MLSPKEIETIGKELEAGNYKPTGFPTTWKLGHWELRLDRASGILSAWRNGHKQFDFDANNLGDDLGVAIECIVLPSIAMEGENIYE